MMSALCMFMMDGKMFYRHPLCYKTPRDREKREENIGIIGFMM